MEQSLWPALLHALVPIAIIWMNHRHRERVSAAERDHNFRVLQDDRQYALSMAELLTETSVQLAFDVDDDGVPGVPPTPGDADRPDLPDDEDEHD